MLADLATLSSRQGLAGILLWCTVDGWLGSDFTGSGSVGRRQGTLVWPKAVCRVFRRDAKSPEVHPAAIRPTSSLRCHRNILIATINLLLWNTCRDLLG